MTLHHYGTRLTQDQIKYIRTKGKGNISAFIREAVDEKIKREKQRK